MLKNDSCCICCFLILIDLINWFLGKWKCLGQERWTKRYIDSYYELMTFSNEEIYDKECSEKE